MKHTEAHVACPACEGARLSVMYAQQLAELIFRDAATAWLHNRRSLAPSTRKNYEDYLLSLNLFFGDLPMRSIHAGHVRSYQKERQDVIRRSKRHLARAEGPPQESDGAARINHEVGCLAQVLEQAGLWQELRRWYEPLPLPKAIGTALSAEEEEHLFKVAKSRSRWMVAYCCAVISRNTTAGPGEIRHLRLRDIELDGPHGDFLHIEVGVKNTFRKRPVPLNEDAAAAVRCLLDRARSLGAAGPDHYLLPHRAHRRGSPADLGRPMGSWKKAHYAMCLEAAKRFPRLAKFRLYDYRHTAATNLLENPAISFTTIEHMLGHRIGSHTKRKYDHLRNSALRIAAEALSRKPPAAVRSAQTFAGPSQGGWIYSSR